jgi:hypothetical protein
VTPSIYNPVFAPAAGLTTNYVAHTGNGFGEPGAVSAILPAAEAREVVVSNQTSAEPCASYSVTLGADAPFATARPTIGGAPVVGGTLRAIDGAWSGTPAIGRSWLRCDAAGAACEPIPGATGAEYIPTDADSGRQLRVRVTAAQGRSVSSDSAPSGAVVPAPRDVTPPSGAVRLASRNLRRAVRRGRVPIRVTCNEECIAAVQLRVARKLARRLKLRGKIVIARVKGAVPAERAVVLRAKLTRKARRALRNRRSLRFRIAATLTDSAGNRAPLARSATMKRPAKRPRRS